MTIAKFTNQPTQEELLKQLQDIVDALGTTSGANIDLSNLSATGEAKFQSPLVSGTNIKTINNTSLLSSGNISVQSTISDLTTIRSNATNGQTAYENMDGNWTASGSQVVNEVSVKYATNYSINLSTYLPDDNLYEVAITGRAISGSSSGNIAPLKLSISGYPAEILVCEARTRSNSTNQATGACTIMLKRTDTIQVVRSNNYNGTVSLWLLKYKKVK